MKRINGSATATTDTSGTATSKSPAPDRPTGSKPKSTAESSEHSIPVRSSSYNCTSETPTDTDQSQGNSPLTNTRDRFTDLDDIGTGVAKQMHANEEQLSLMRLPVQLVSGIDEALSLRVGRRDKDECENLPLESQDCRSSSVVRSRSARHRLSMPAITTNSIELAGSDDRTPTGCDSFWGTQESDDGGA